MLFRNYLRGDPTVQDWAEGVVGDAVADAEKDALAAHQRAMEASGGGPRVITAADDQPPGPDRDNDMATADLGLTRPYIGRGGTPP